MGPRLGRGLALPPLIAAARADGIAVAVHLEPYAGRTRREHGRRRRVPAHATASARSTSIAPLDLPVADWAAAQVALHAGGTTLFAQTPLVGAAAAAGFDGVYTYDIVTYGGSKFARLCDAGARAAAALRAVGRPRLRRAPRQRRPAWSKPRRHGATYDAMWRAAIARAADRVTITSYNEWHEGTQIEPAAPPTGTAGTATCRTTARGGCTAWLPRTRTWRGRATGRTSSAARRRVQLKTRAS